MTEYIEREAAIEWFKPHLHMDEPIQPDVALEYLRAIPAADVAPVVHGRWISDKAQDEVSGEMCSICCEGSAPATPMTVTLSGLIPFGRRNAISREALAAKLRMSDRQMRKAVEDARAEGLIILCECNGRGYYQSDDLAEMRYQYQQDTNRAMSILKRRKPLRDALRAAGQSV